MQKTAAALRPSFVRSACLGVLVVAAVRTSGAEPLDRRWFAEHYTKREHRIPMRDGVRLFTVAYSPKDASVAYPILLQRTPYNLKPYTVDAGDKPGGLPDSYVREKFIFALQDVRGRFGSEGEFIDVRPHKAFKSGPADTDESTDTYDTVDWLVKNVSGNNGSVGLQGISYLGFFAAAGMIDSHPALKAVSPQAPVADMFDGDDLLHGGGLWLAHNFSFFHFFGQKLENPLREEPRRFDYGTPDGYAFFLAGGSVTDLAVKHFRGGIQYWDRIMRNIQDASWCRSHDITPHLKNVKAAVLTVGGWFDAEDLSGTLKTYQATERQNPGIVNSLVMGPWAHGGWHFGDGDRLGPVEFRAKTAVYFRDEIELPFFRRFLKGQTGVETSEAYVFETGTCEWRREPAWPPLDAEPRALFLHAGGRLAFAPPDGAAPAFDEYASDPSRPVPYTSRITPRMHGEYMIEDQRFAATRPDVLVYQTEPLLEDVTVAGPVAVSLHVSTTGTDSDWVVKLIDVYSGDHPDPDPNPAGVRLGHGQQLVRGEPQRGKYREGYDRPKAMVPGEVTKVAWVMPDICHTFRSGHRIMIHIQSTWFPLLDRNPQTFCDIYRARPEDFRAATQRVWRGAAQPSSITLRVRPIRR